jgi:FAD/FMN-containing dehydrogenase
MRSWGRLSHHEHDVVALTECASVHAHLSSLSSLSSKRPGLAYGMGRSYGDVCLNAQGVLWTTSGLDHFIAFDEHTGRLSCEAGVLLRDIARVMIPRGWMLPVTPGTQLITLGGAIANDVHGKNHAHMGSFGDHICQLTLVRTDGEIIQCAPDERPDWFAATVGGAGLTGVITQAQIQLRRVSGPWLDTETIPYDTVSEFFELSATSEALWEHAVSWIDCLSGGGRGLFMRGNYADDAASTAASEVASITTPSRKRTISFVPPVSLANRLTLLPLNKAYYALKKRHAGRQRVHYEPFFYPLDHVLNWNRLYGPKGFFQYQCVVPREVGPDAVQALLKDIARSNDGSFLAVLKNFGERQPLGLLSFPQPGVTLAIDFPNRGARTHTLFARLDAIVREAKGRLYLAKDARMPRELFEAGYPRLPEFMRYRDPGISSGLSRRLMGT